MPMRDQPKGVHRRRRGTDKPPREYDIYVDDEPAGVAERLANQGVWRMRPAGPTWPKKFTGNGAYLEGVAWLADLHRAAKKSAELTREPVVIAEGAQVQVLSPVVADPFKGDPFADPLA